MMLSYARHMPPQCVEGRSEREDTTRMAKRATKLGRSAAETTTSLDSSVHRRDSQHHKRLLGYIQLVYLNREDALLRRPSAPSLQTDPIS